MNRFCFYTIIIVLTSLFVSCLNDESELSDSTLIPVTFNASPEATKTTYSYGEVLWEDSDAISLFSGNDFGTKTSLSAVSVDEDRLKATFQGFAAVDSPSYIAVYPDSDSNAYSGSSLTVNIPSEQTALAGSFMSGANTSVAVSEDETFVFRNVGALIGVFIGESDAGSSAVTLRARKEESGFYGLTGSVQVSIKDEIPVASEGSANYVTLHAPAEGFKAGSVYYAVVCPGDYNGFELDFLKEGKTVRKSDHTSCSLVRSTSIKIGPDFSVPSGIPEDLVVNLDFSKGWPFAEPCVSEDSQEATGENYTYRYDYMEDEESRALEMEFAINSGVKHYGRYHYDNDENDGNGRALCYKFGSETDTGYGYIKFPVIEGKYLQSIALVHRTPIPSGATGNDLNGFFFTLQKGGFPSHATPNITSNRVKAGEELVIAFPMEGLVSELGQYYCLRMRYKDIEFEKITLIYSDTMPSHEMGEVTEPELPDEFSVFLDFKTGWPFEEPCVAASEQNKGGEPYTYSYKYGDSDSETTTFDFMISHGTTNTSIDYSYSDGALRFNSTGGNNGEIKLPGIEGYYLNRVEARHISDDKSRFALKDYFIAKTETLTERLLAGWATTGALTVFWMPVTEGLAQKQQPGQSFTLEMRDKNMAVSEIKLVYTKTKPMGEPPLNLSDKHLYAHRGKWSKSGSDYFIPENSLTGIQMAAMMGYEGIECDVKYTKDKVMVVMHDATINKSMRNADYTEISGDVKVADLTFEELRNNYVLESTEPAFRLPCPTLEEMLLECKRCGMRPMLHSSIYESYELAQKIMGDDWVCFTSSNFDNVLRVRSELNSNCTILWSISSGFDTVETELVKIGGDCGISSMESGYYTKDMIDRLRGAGYHVQCSIFPSGEERLAIENGVDYILSDHVIPEGARKDITADEILAAYPPLASAPDELPEEFSIVLNFAEGCPFVEGEYVVPELQDPEGGESYTYRYSDGDFTKDFVFKFYARNAESTYSLYQDANGNVIGLYAGDAIAKNNCSLQILTPAINNRYLSEVSYVTSDAAGIKNARLVLSDQLNGGNVTAAGAILKQTWTFPYTSGSKSIESVAGKSYVVRSRDDKNIIVSLTLTYTKTNPSNL